MQEFIEFFSFQDPNARWVALGVMVMCASSAIVGVFALLRKRALVGDAVSHAILPGICLAFMVTGQKNAWALLPGAFVSGWFSMWVIDFVSNHSKIKSDTAIALVLSVFYGFGILLLTSLQSSGQSNQSGLDKFLFGKAAALTQEDVIVFTGFGLFLLLILFFFYKSFKIISFDRDFAISSGFPVRNFEILLSSLTVLAVAIGIQAVGVVLMAALLISPAAAARYWTNHLRVMIFLAAIFGIFAGLSATFISYTWTKMPTGPWVVMVLSLLAVFSVLAGSKRGVIAHQIKLQKNQRKMREENILKCMYHLGELDQEFARPRSLQEMQAKRAFHSAELKQGLKTLQRKRLLASQGPLFYLTPQGIEEGKRVTRIHRLWELYITKHMHLASDHVHEDAEAIEHIITPEIEQELALDLNYPMKDPHQSPIPYRSGKN